MSSEKDIARAINWNKANSEKHRESVNKCAKRRFNEAKSLSLYSYKLPEEVIILDSRRCRFNNMTYRIGTSGYIVTNKALGNGKYESHKLHRDIWKYYTGKDIPDGYQIHHVDGDLTNNLICNLLLVDKNLHKKLHNRRVRA